MQQNLQRLSIGGHDDQVRDTSVQGLGGLVGALLELLVVRGLLDQIQDSHSELGISKRVGLGVNFAHFNKFIRQKSSPH